MRRIPRTLAISIGLILLALIAWQLLGQTPPPGISAALLTPAPTPADGRMVAVLRLRITSDAAGEVADVVMTEGLVQIGYGPNVLNRPGAWTVSLTSAAEEALRFGIPDPRQVRVESAAFVIPHTSSFLPEVEFDLVVPLSDPLGGDLAVTDLRLYDQPGNLIFAAGLRGEKIAPIPVRQVRVSPAG
jgi:hypothetical protein